MAEWLRRGLQILARRFDSGSGLHFLVPARCSTAEVRLWAGTGAALAQLVEHIIRNDGVTGSNPVVGTTKQITLLPDARFRLVAINSLS